MADQVNYSACVCMYDYHIAASIETFALLKARAYVHIVHVLVFVRIRAHVCVCVCVCMHVIVLLVKVHHLPL